MAENDDDPVALLSARFHPLLHQRRVDPLVLEFGQDRHRLPRRPGRVAFLFHGSSPSTSNSPLVTVTALPPKKARSLATLTFTTPPLADA